MFFSESLILQHIFSTTCIMNRFLQIFFLSNFQMSSIHWSRFTTFPRGWRCQWKHRFLACSFTWTTCERALSDRLDHPHWVWWILLSWPPWPMKILSDLSSFGWTPDFFWHRKDGIRRDRISYFPWIAPPENWRIHKPNQASGFNTE